MEGAARRLVVAILESVAILVTALVEALVRALRSRPFEVAVNLILINGVAILLRAGTAHHERAQFAIKRRRPRNAARWLCRPR